MPDSNRIYKNIEITDFSTPELDLYARLSETQLFHYYEPEAGVFLAETTMVIGRALDAGYKAESFLIEKRLLNGPVRELLLRCPGVPVYTAETNVLKQLTGYALTRGVLCAMRRKEMPKLSEELANARRIVVLEHVMNPTNVGTIFRSAAAMGMDAVLLSPDCADPLYRRAARVSVGTVFQIPWIHLRGDADPKEGDLIQRVRKEGFYTVAMALQENSRRIDDPVLKEKEKLAIVLGSEGYGLNEDTVASCDCAVRIPMSHGVDSLNVAAAGAVAFWELCKGNT